MDLRDLAKTEASAFIERLAAAAEERAEKARAEAEAQVNEIRGELESLRTELESETARAAAFEADLDAVIEAHRQVDSERIAAENGRTQEASARSRAEDELRGVRELLDRARKEASRLSEALEDEAAEKALVQEEVDAARRALTVLEKSYETAEKKIGKLEGRVGELQELESSLRGELAGAVERVNAAEAEAVAVTTQMRARYDTDMRAARTQIDALTTERDTARAELETIRAKVDALGTDLAALRKTAEAHKAKAESLASERDAVKSQAEGFKRDADKLKADVAAARAGTDALRTQAESSRTQEERLRAEVELARDESRTLRTEIDRFRAEADRHRKELESLRANSSGASAELTSLREMLDASRVHHEKQVAAAKELEARLRTAEGQLKNGDTGGTSTLTAAVRAVEALGAATTISELFGTVVKQLSTELPRVAVFRVKGTHVEGEHGAGFDESMLINKIVIPMTLDSVITRAAQGGGMVRADGADLAASRPPLGGAAVSAVAVPIVFQDETLAVLYADSDKTLSQAQATVALLIARHASVLLSRLTQELKVLKELRDYAMMLLQEAEQMFVADVDSGKPAKESLRRLRDTVDCGRQLYAQRAALEGAAAAGLFDEQISIVINAQASAFAEALAAATQDKKRAAS